jgi:hypothetical protein
LLGAFKTGQSKLTGRGLLDSAAGNWPVAHLRLGNTLVTHCQAVEVLLDLTGALTGKLFGLPQVAHELREINANAK